MRPCTDMSLLFTPGFQTFTIRTEAAPLVDMRAILALALRGIVVATMPTGVPLGEALAHFYYGLTLALGRDSAMAGLVNVVEVAHIGRFPNEVTPFRFSYRFELHLS